MERYHIQRSEHLVMRYNVFSLKFSFQIYDETIYKHVNSIDVTVKFLFYNNNSVI